MEIDVIIPSYKPGREFLELLERLEEQTVLAERILVMNTEKRYLDELTGGADLRERFPRVEVYFLSKQEFDHGGTRNRAAGKCGGDIFICMTQDAVPADRHLIERLTEALEREDVAVAYARQLARKDSGEIERFTRRFNYPKESCVKGAQQLEELGIKTFFCSDVCAAYKKKIFDELGGFTEHTMFNEDMIYAAGAVRAGWKIAYAAQARVYHSHNYSCGQQFRRNFDNGVSQAQHPEVFSGISAESEGLRLVGRTAAHLCRVGKPWLVGKLAAESAAKYAGFFLGKRYRHLPGWVVKRCSASKDYWT